MTHLFSVFAGGVAEGELHTVIIQRTSVQTYYAGTSFIPAYVRTKKQIVWQVGRVYSVRDERRSQSLANVRLVSIDQHDARQLPEYYVHDAGWNSHMAFLQYWVSRVRGDRQSVAHVKRTIGIKWPDWERESRQVLDVLKDRPQHLYTVWLFTVQTV